MVQLNFIAGHQKQKIYTAGHGLSESCVTPNKGVLQKKSSSPQFEQIFGQHIISGPVRNFRNAWQPYRNHAYHRDYSRAKKISARVKIGPRACSWTTLA